MIWCEILFEFPEGDEVRGIGLLRSIKPLDRESGAKRFLPLVLMDGKGLSATTTLTVTIEDVNDNRYAK